MWLIIFIFSIIVAILSATIMPALNIFNSTVNLNLLLVLIFLFYDKKKEAGIFILISSVVLAVLTGINLITILLPIFFLLIIYSFLIDKRILNNPTIFMASLLFFSASMFTEVIVVALTKSFSLHLLKTIIISSIFNMILGAVFYYFCNRIYYFLNPQVLREKIKFSR